MRNGAAIRTIRGVALSALLLTALVAPATASATLEEPVTQPATGVTATEATLHGEVNPNASATAGYHFTWNEAVFGCEGNETEAHEEQTGEGIPAEATLTGLIPHKEYGFCVVATHLEGETFESIPGPVVTFETESLAPAVDAESASSITPFAATLEAQVNPQNEPTTSCKIEWGTASASENEAACEPEALEGFGDQTVSHRLEGLEPATGYKFKVIVANATGTGEAEGEFTTSPLEAPIVDSESVSAVTTNQARLEAQVNPNYQEATYVFEYATNEAMTGATVVEPPEGTEPFPAGFEDHAASVLLKPTLSPGTRYFFRVAATNATGTMQGPVQSFITVGAPTVEETGIAAQVGRASVRLEGGEVDPVGAETTWYYRYVDETGYAQGLAEDPQEPYVHGASSLPLGHLAAAQGAQALPSVSIGELKPATTYHFALVAENEAGRTIGEDETFTTGAPTPPLASTGPASGVGQTTATIGGTVDSGGLATTWLLQLSSEAGLWSTVASGTLSESAEPTALTLGLSFLAPGTTYRYRLVAANADGEANGGEQTFTTASLPAPPGLAPAPGPVPFTPLAVLEKQEPHGSSGAAPPHLTRKQKLAKALKKCRKRHARKRMSCERAARKRFGKKKH
jgi:hypothetical protein